jgi:hypothetical protein
VTAGWSAASLANLMNEAAILTVSDVVRYMCCFLLHNICHMPELLFRVVSSAAAANLHLLAAVCNAPCNLHCRCGATCLRSACQWCLSCTSYHRCLNSSLAGSFDSLFNVWVRRNMPKISPPMVLELVEAQELGPSAPRIHNQHNINHLEKPEQLTKCSVSGPA